MSPKAFRLVDELGREPKKAQTPKPIREIDRPAPPLPNDHAAAAAQASMNADDGAARIIRVTPMDGGEWVSVTVSVGKERKYFRLLTEQYAALRPAVGVVPPELMDALVTAGKLCDAIRKGMELLGYGAVSRRRLTQKLMVRGFDRETADAAVSYLDEHGLLPEADDAIRFAEQGVRKLWGPRRIRDDLFARGFPSEAISVAIDHLEDVDFVENCGRVIVKKYGGIPKDRVEIKKMVAALMRLGYTSEQIRDAMR